MACLEDGRIVEDDVLRNWYSGNAMPQLGGQSLIEGGNPMRWMVDRSLGPAEMPSAYIEFFSGDRLPGHTDSYTPEGLAYQTVLPEHFTLSPSFPFRKSSDARYRSDLRVRRDMIRKIVWQQIPALIDRYVPSTVFLTNGREISFRAIRFTEGSIQLLSGRERISIGFHEIAELHLPNESPWETHLLELAILFPGGKTDREDHQRLVQWETSDGLVATTSVDRIDADSRGDNNNSDRWNHGIQPAWSLDMIWVECRSTWMRRSWRFDEMPLFRVPYHETREEAMFSRNGFSARINRGVLAGTAKSGEHASGWNFGVMAPSRLSIDLPPLARGFRGSLGIDQAAHDRGCIRGKVFLSWESSPKFESKPIIGSAEVVQIPEFRWDKVPQSGQLILETDMVKNGHPAEADPFDIRDMTNWIEPRIMLDKQQLQEAILQLTPKTILAWQGWKLETELDKLQFATTLRQVQYPFETPSWRTTVVAKDEPLRLISTQKIAANQTWLEVSLAKFHGNDQPTIDIVIDGIPVFSRGMQNVNTYDHVNSPAPFLVNLQPFAGHEATFEISQSVGPKDVPVDWRAIAFLSEPTFLAPILENPTQVQVDAMQTIDAKPAEVTWRNDIRLLTRPAIEIPDGPWVQIASFDRPIEIREQPLPGQFRQIRIAFQKKGKGHVLIRFLHEKDDELPVVYAAGISKAGKGIISIDGNKLDENWHEVTGDLYSNFHDLDITGIAISSVGEGTSLWDHIVFANSAGNFDRLVSVSPVNSNWDDWEKRSADLMPQAIKGLVEVHCPGKPVRPAYMINQGEGIFAMLGYDDWKRNEKVEVVRNDGKKFSAKCLGMDASSKLGLIKLEKIEQDGGWSQLNLSGKERFEPQYSYMLIQPDGRAESINWDICRPTSYSNNYEILSIPNRFDCRVGAIALDVNHQIGGFVKGLSPNGNPVLVSVRQLFENLTTLQKD
ncbi:hypothetical protein GC197_06910 [bacterium]|nr:hypothetical protein [bacterium]